MRRRRTIGPELFDLIAAVGLFLIAMASALPQIVDQERQLREETLAGIARELAGAANRERAGLIALTREAAVQLALDEGRALERSLSSRDCGRHWTRLLDRPPSLDLAPPYRREEGRFAVAVSDAACVYYYLDGSGPLIDPRTARMSIRLDPAAGAVTADTAM